MFSIRGPTPSARMVVGSPARSLSESTDSFIFTGTYALQGADPVVPILLKMVLTCDFNASCDFDNTGAVNSSLLSNVTFTSQSGVFVTQGPAVAAPEPSSGYLLAIAFAAGLILRLKKPRQIIHQGSSSRR
jgi:hypothetical protein